METGARAGEVALALLAGSSACADVELKKEECFGIQLVDNPGKLQVILVTVERILRSEAFFF